MVLVKERYQLVMQFCNQLMLLHQWDYQERQRKQQTEMVTGTEAGEEAATEEEQVGGEDADLDDGTVRLFLRGSSNRHPLLPRVATVSLGKRVGTYWTFQN